MKKSGRALVEAYRLERALKRRGSPSGSGPRGTAREVLECAGGASADQAGSPMMSFADEESSDVVETDRAALIGSDGLALELDGSDAVIEAAVLEVAGVTVNSSGDGDEVADGAAVGSTATRGGRAKKKRADPASRRGVWVNDSGVGRSHFRTLLDETFGERSGPVAGGGPVAAVMAENRLNAACEPVLPATVGARMSGSCGVSTIALSARGHEPDGVVALPDGTMVAVAAGLTGCGEGAFDNAQVDTAQVADAQVDTAQTDDAQVDDAQVHDAREDDAQASNAHEDHAQVGHAQDRPEVERPDLEAGDLDAGARPEGGARGEAARHPAATRLETAVEPAPADRDGTATGPGMVEAAEAGDTPDAIAPSPLSAICQIGPGITRKLDQLGIRSIADLIACDPDQLKEDLGSLGAFANIEAWRKRALTHLGPNG